MAWAAVEIYYLLVASLVWTPTSEETGYEASNLIDGLDVTWWLATSSATQYLTFDSGFGNTVSADYLAIGSGHNLSTIGATVTWQYSTDAAAWNDVVTGSTPSDDKSLVIKAGSTQTYRAFRVAITGASAAAAITLCYMGMKTILKFADLYDPQRKRRNQVINITEGGRLDGAAIRYTQRQIDLKFKNADSTLYDKIDALWQNHGIKLFFIAYDPGDHATVIYPVYIDDKDRNAPFTVSGVLRKEGIKLKGLYE